MSALIQAALDRSRTVLLLLLLMLTAGGVAYVTVPKEAAPDIDIPIFFVSMTYSGISPEDSERLLVHPLERELRPVAGLDELRAQAGEGFALLRLDFEPGYDNRQAMADVLARLRAATEDLPGVVLQFREQQRGPGGAKPILVEVSGRDDIALAQAVAQLRGQMDVLGGFVDVEDDRSLPGVEVRAQVNHREAARYGADIGLLGNAVQMLTQGIRLGGYRPDDADEEVDIRVRFPFDERNLAQLGSLRVPTTFGLVPVENFVDFQPAPRTGIIRRVDARRTLTVSADAAPGLLVNEQVRRLQAALETDVLPDGVTLRLRGEEEDQAEAAAFLQVAFLLSIFMILVTQFNSLYQALLVLSAIVFSTAGVLLGLLIRNEPFGLVMSGVGVIALAGVVVNNNIVLIDTYNILRRHGLDALDAALRTGAQRLRPVLLTTITTILGLMPMVIMLTVDFFGRDVSLGAPSTQFWVQLATAISGGLLLATPLTLLLTPVMLVWADQRPSVP